MLKKLLGDNYNNSIAQMIIDGHWAFYSIAHHSAKYAIYIPADNRSDSKITQRTMLLDDDGQVIDFYEGYCNNLILLKAIRNFPDDLMSEISKEQLQQLIEKLEL